MALIWLGEVPELSADQVGGKARSINHMLALGLPVPPAFVLTTDVCHDFAAAGGVLGEALRSQIRDAVLRVGAVTGRVFGGDHPRPLLVSVRSGAAQSMPGMMDTVLNLGINTQVQTRLAEQSGDPAYAADTLRRFRQQFRSVVGIEPPEDPWDQLFYAIGAVFTSWNSPRAAAYRDHHGISDAGGTAVTVQSMVFGNLDDQSGTGVLFSRNPLTGEREPYGEWLLRGQGEDVVSGRTTPLTLDALAERFPHLHKQLLSAASTLETVGKDVQDIEFTVESGKLWFLQTRAAKRSPDAAVAFAVALHEDGLITKREALQRVSADLRTALTKPRILPGARAAATVLARGVAACPGVASGRVVTDIDDAIELSDDGVDVVLARPHTDPGDIGGMIAAAAILTEVGGSTSHAAVVSRELGTPCIVGCGDNLIATLEGLDVTVDATNGEVLSGVLPLAPTNESDNPSLAVLLSWETELATTSLGH
jgi:pyruvate,orthophosphate dikinase